MKTIIIKQNPAGEEVWRYEGTIMARDENTVVVEAFFDREDMAFHGIALCKGDRFVETYYLARWYNIFEIHARSDDQLKGWYCNISSPATVQEGVISYRDLALDLLVFPDGRQVVLDEDEFEMLSLPLYEREMALTALAALQANFKEKIRALK